MVTKRDSFIDRIAQDIVKDKDAVDELRPKRPSGRDIFRRLLGEEPPEEPPIQPEGGWFLPTGPGYYGFPASEAISAMPVEQPMTEVGRRLYEAARRTELYEPFTMWGTQFAQERLLAPEERQVYEQQFGEKYTPSYPPGAERRLPGYEELAGRYQELPFTQQMYYEAPLWIAMLGNVALSFGRGISTARGLRALKADFQKTPLMRELPPKVRTAVEPELFRAYELQLKGNTPRAQEILDRIRMAYSKGPVPKGRELAPYRLGVKPEVPRPPEVKPVVPKAEAGMPEAGLQETMFPREVAAREVFPKGRGVPTQISMADQLKLQQARALVQQDIAEIDTLEGLQSARAEIETEIGNRRLPYHGGAKAGPYTGWTTKQLDEMLRTYDEAMLPVERAVEPPPPVEPPAKPPVEVTPPPLTPEGKPLMVDLQDTQTAITIATKPDFWRDFSDLPIVKNIMATLNPSAIANTPSEKSVIARAVLRDEGNQKSQGIMSLLNQLGTQQEIFGKLDAQGKIAAGTLKGLTVNDVRTYPKKYQLSPEQRKWVEQAQAIEEAKLAFLTRNGIEINELTFEEGGVYAGRRVFGKLDPEGELIEARFIGAGPGRPGAKLVAEKPRFFASVKEATEAGYRYLPDDEALALNVRGAYNRVADKQAMDWLLTQVPWRTTGAPEELVLAAESAKVKYRHSQQLLAALNRANRGEKLPTATINSIASAYPNETNALKAIIDSKQAGKKVTAEVTELRRKAKVLIESDRKEWNATVTARARARERAIRPQFGEAQVQAPALAGKILTGPDAQKTADILRKSFEPSFSKALAAPNKVNAVVRYFLLAGDVSPMAIQLLFLAGENPVIYLKAFAGFINSMFDTKFHANYLAKNKDIIDASPNLILTRSGTEFTEAMHMGGWLYTVGTPLRPFQRGFEGSLDVAGIELKKSLMHLAETPDDMAQIDQFINEFRGLTSSARLGVSPRWRQVETNVLLAPRYNRAIAALLFDAFKGVAIGKSGIRPALARDALAKGIAAVSAMAVAISIAMGENRDEILEHFNPQSSRFFTWNIHGTNIGPGTKIRSVIKLFAESAENPEALLQMSMENPALRFIRGNLAPVLGTSVDILTGKNYIGDPVRDNWKSFGKEILAGNLLPIWVENVLFEGGKFSERLIRGSGEFFGGRAYPETEYDKVSRLRERYAKLDYDKKWEDLNNAQRGNLKRKYSDLAQMEEETKEAWAERGSPLERWYHNEKIRLTNERNKGLEKVAQALLEGRTSKYEYDKERARIRPYYSGGKEVLWSAKETLDEYSVKQLEKWLDEHEKPEDKALGQWHEFRAEWIEKADLPRDWDIIEAKTEALRNYFPKEIADYILEHRNDWIQDLPENARKIEEMRATGIEDETWWDNYREVGIGRKSGRDIFRELLR